MKVKHTNLIDIELPNKGAFTIETEFNFPKLHTLTIASGRRGGGKSVSIANFVKKCKKKHYFDRVYLITPTYQSNKEIWNIADIQEEDIIEPTITAIYELIERVEQEKQEWDNFLEKKKSYLKFMKDKKNLSRVTDEDIIIYYDMLFLDGKKPEWKYAKEQPPRLAVIIDDALGTPLLARSTAGLLNLCIKHRHIADGLGISIFMLVQSYCAQGGLNRAIRENTTNLLLFKVNDENQIKKVKEECDLPVTEEEFTELCNYAHSIPFNFLFIDFNPKCKRLIFRSGWNDYLIPKSLENIKCECERCTNKMTKKIKEIKIIAKEKAE